MSERVGGGGKAAASATTPSTDAVRATANWLAGVAMRLAGELETARGVLESARESHTSHRVAHNELVAEERRARRTAEAEAARAARHAEERVIAVLGLRMRREEGKTKEAEEEVSGDGGESVLPSVDEISRHLESGPERGLHALRQQLQTLERLHEEVSKETEARLLAEARAAELEDQLKSSEKTKRGKKRTVSSASPRVVYIADDFDPYASASSLSADDSDDSDWAENDAGGKRGLHQRRRRRIRVPTQGEEERQGAGTKRERLDDGVERKDEEESTIAAAVAAVLAADDASPPPAPPSAQTKRKGLQPRAANVPPPALPAEAKRRRVLGAGQKGSIGVAE
jgi:hypothetical protein